ncbi:MAG: IS66 family insertion sequence element accessory protein TnpA, partial [Butyricicoccus sp.]
MTSAELKHRAKLQEWSARIQNCRSSGLSVRAWCRQEGINASTYYRWE